MWIVLYSVEHGQKSTRTLQTAIFATLGWGWGMEQEKKKKRCFCQIYLSLKYRIGDKLAYSFIYIPCYCRMKLRKWMELLCLVHTLLVVHKQYHLSMCCCCLLLILKPTCKFILHLKFYHQKLFSFRELICT